MAKKLLDVRKFCTEARLNPAINRCQVAEWSADNRSQAIIPEQLSLSSKTTLEFFKPILGAVSWECAGMSPIFQKAHEHTAKLAACHAMAVRLIGPAGGDGGFNQLKREATTAGVDLPVFTRQLLLTITRAYAQLFTLQLFGVIPLQGPTGRMMFKDFQYDSAFTGSAPYINPGDRDDVIASFNPNYGLTPEGVQANKRKLHMSNLDISTSDYREVGEWTDQAEDDAMALYGDSVRGDIMSHLAQEQSRTVDRNVLGAMINAVPAANQYTWTGSPTSNPAYSTLSPSEKSAYDELIFKDGIQTTINKINITRKYNNDGMPTWAVCGTTFALRLAKLSAAVFTSASANNAELEGNRGALRDLGMMNSLGLRFLVDPMLGQSVSGGADMCFFGRKPVQRGDVGIYWAPYISLQPTKDLFDPDTGKTAQGVRSRYGIVQPNTGTNAASSQLGEVYGQLTVSAGGAGV